METDPKIIAARAKLLAKVGDSRTGGKGSARRKKVQKHHDTSVDEKKLSAGVRKLGWQAVPAINEVNLFKEDGKIIHFNNPKFEVSQGLSGYMVSGKGELKTIQDLLPGILDQLDSRDVASLRKMAAEFQSQAKKQKDAADDDDDDFGVGGVDFEATSKS